MRFRRASKMVEFNSRRGSSLAITRLLHSFQPQLDSIMTLAYYVCPLTSRRLIIAGTQSGAVLALDMLTLQPLKTLWPGGKNGVMRRTHRPILSLAIVASSSVGTTAFTTEDGATNNPEEALLVSAGSDGLLRCWSLDPRWWSAIDENNNYNGSDDDDNGGHCRFVIHAGHDCGDIFAMAYHPPTATLYLACKNGSIQWFPMLQRHQMCRQRMRQEWAKRDSRFFSLGNESRHSLEFATGEAVSTATASTFIHESSEEHPAVVGKQHRTYLILENMMLPMAHNGYIYCLLIGRLPHSSADYLFSGSGDGTVKIWEIQQQHKQKIAPVHLRTLQCTSGSVLSLHVRDGLLYTGVQGGTVRVWDLETFHCIRVLSGHSDDVLAIAAVGPLVFTGSADGQIRKWNRNFECIQTIGAINSIASPQQQHLSNSGEDRGVYALTISHNLLVSGGGDSQIRLWDISLPVGTETAACNFSFQMFSNVADGSCAETAVEPLQDRMLMDLEKLVALRSVSGQDGRFHEDCRLAAKFLKSLLTHLGADAKLVAGAPGRNPLVLARFCANHNSLKAGSATTKNILFYGHYDVQPANADQWKSDPFQLTGRDGFLYGRGVTDNKGPILATIYAAHELYESRQLQCNMYFLIEGEEESGSIGFFEAVMEHKSFFPDRIDGILLSNSYWLNDEIPCLTYGLRGVIHSTLEIKSPTEEDLHSGVYGGALDEPLVDMIKILSQLYSSDDSRVRIPHFYEPIRPTTNEELESYRAIAEHVAGRGKYVNDSVNGVVNALKQRWRQPTLSIHKVEVSGPAGSNNTVIPKSATAAVSMRIVPDQQLSQIIDNYRQFVTDCFLRLRSRNRFSMTIGHRADWWIADQQSDLYRLAAESIASEWGVQQPLHIREGGSIPAIPFLEKIFDARAVHIPMGQASDNAHLPDERMRLQNLSAGRKVIKRFLQGIHLI